MVDKVPQHQCPVGRPGWATVGHPVPELPENMPDPHTRHPKSQQLVLKADLIHPFWPC